MIWEKITKRVLTLLTNRTLILYLMPVLYWTDPGHAESLPLNTAAISDPHGAHNGAPVVSPDDNDATASAQQVESLQQQINALQARLQGLSANPSLAQGSVQPTNRKEVSTVALLGQTAVRDEVAPTKSEALTSETVVSAQNTYSNGVVGAPATKDPAHATGPAAESPAQPTSLPQTTLPPEPAISAQPISTPAPPAPPALPVAKLADNPSLVPSTDVQRQAYASGVGVWQDIGNSLASQRSMGIELDPNYVMAGVRDAFAGHGLKMSASDISDAINDLNRVYTERAIDVRMHQETEGKAYRISFSKQKGAFSDAGAWYRIGNKGKGAHLRPSDMAVLQITGTLPDGSVFDASGRDGQERTVKVGAMLPAVAIGLQKVGVGGELTVVVPPGKGYGDAGMPPAIPGGATLIFDIVVKGVESGR